MSVDLNNGRLAAFLIIWLLLCACLRDEEPVQPYDRGEQVTQSVSLTRTYENQVWYSLKNNEVVTTNSKMDWDVRFWSEPETDALQLNFAKSMSAYRTGETDFDKIQDTAGFKNGRKFDAPSGNLDSTAVTATDEIYIIDMGFAPDGTHVGFYKLKVLKDGNRFQLQYGTLKSNDPEEIELEPDLNTDFTYFSMTASKQVYPEPQKGEYDLLFTQYTHLFQEPFMPYLVVGCVTRPKIRSGEINSIPFEEISIEDTSHVHFSTAQNFIGYDWKEFDLNENTYTIDTERVFIIQYQSGLYYKLHFLDFLDVEGNRGAPTFSFKVL